MKKFFLYILLPGIILGVFYQAGQKSGSRLESDNITYPVMSDEARAAASEEKRLLIAEKVSQLNDLGIKVGDSLPGIPPRSTDHRSRAVVATPKESERLRIPEQESVDRFRERPVNSGIEPVAIDPATVLEPVSFSPATNPLGSLPAGRSVYDRRELPKASDVGFLPLAPLVPIESSSVLPSVPSRTTFKEPALSTPAVVASPVPASRSFLPVRLTISSDCDCD